MTRALSAYLSVLLSGVIKEESLEDESSLSSPRNAVPAPMTPPELIAYAQLQSVGDGTTRGDRSRSPKRSDAKTCSSVPVKREKSTLSTRSQPDNSVGPWAQLINDHFEQERKQRFASGLKYTPVQEGLGVGMGSCAFSTRVS